MSAPARPRVLHVTSWYPSRYTPLQGSFVRDHVRASAVGADVAVIHLHAHQEAMRWSASRERLSDELVPTEQVRFGGVVGAWSMLRATMASERSLAKDVGSFDVVHAHVLEAAIPAAILARRLRRPLVVSEHWTVYMPADPSYLPGWLRVLGRWALHQAARVLPVGPGLQQAMATVAPRARFEVVPNVVDVEQFTPGPSHGGPLVVAAVGLLTRQKGFDDLVRAMATVRERAPGARLVVVGDGPDRSALEQLAHRESLDGAITFEGALARSEVANVLRASTLLCVPSRYETFSVVAAEALASGRPVVATRCGGPEAYVTAGQGELVGVGDVPALAEAIVRVGARSWDPTSLARYASERFAPDVVAEQLSSIYEDVLEEHR